MPLCGMSGPDKQAKRVVGEVRIIHDDEPPESSTHAVIARHWLRAAGWVADDPRPPVAMSDAGERPTAHAVPVSDHAVPVSDHAVPVSDHAVPVSDHAVPVSDHAVPVSDHAISVGDAALWFTL
jgi:hypothetical protein